MSPAAENQVILFELPGSIDLSGGNLLTEEIARIIPAKNQIWVFNFASVNFMDSSGLVALVNGYKKARQHSCRFVLCNLQAPVRLILEVTQLDSVFEIYDTYEDIFAESASSALPDLVVAS
ncbi:STAS domain-containing protein [Calothrix sp. NIES-3974]|uniref:STAS domain-containing protein n=1 Tax=Calothrix sp. NIES-3974 TaxID=2005462 RepID=UPI000B6106CD|nr:STAS domain-containing protein [Calothrix sp. NIES-3974]BAZ04538.1 anti-sigma-factor antagonist [Calothrix sp. NIES-3974]